jgi:uncharacterized SAM-binding protein YcdF (DUF218 family)
LDLIWAKAVGALLLPPALNLLLALLALALRRRARRLALALVAVSFASLHLLSTPWVAGTLARALEHHPALDLESDAASGAQAIVLLAGGRDTKAPEYGGVDSVSPRSLVRLRYAAWLHRRTGLPLLVSGGTVRGERKPEAELIAQVLSEELGVEPRWRETGSRNTAENATYSAALLERDGIERALLVTHASHMARAVSSFARAGLVVVPAPTAFLSAPPDASSSAPPDASSSAPAVFDWLPSAGALRVTSIVLHEHLGMLWYRLRY